MKELIKKLANAKKEIGKISKDSENPFFKSKYFDINSLLEHTESVLEKHGLMILQPIIDNKVITRIYDIETGEYISSELELPNEINPHKIGSAITYYRRYPLQSLLALQAEDDDGNKASKKEKTSTGGQLIKIENLIHTSLLSEDQRNEIERDMENYTSERANKCITYLLANQLPPMEQQSPSQTDIKNHLKTK